MFPKLSPESVLISSDGRLLDVLFVGECTHDFTVAAGRLCEIFKPVNSAGDVSPVHNWCSTEWMWPSESDRTHSWLLQNRRDLKSAGVWCSDGIYATDLERTLQTRNSPKSTFDVVLWIMPYPDKRTTNYGRPIDLHFHHRMNDLLYWFSMSAAQLLRDGGKIVVVVKRTQYYDWKLNWPVQLGERQVFEPSPYRWDWEPLLNTGYFAHFGNAKDNDREASFFNPHDSVAVLWQALDNFQLHGQPHGLQHGEQLEVGWKTIEKGTRLFVSSYANMYLDNACAIKVGRLTKGVILTASGNVVHSSGEGHMVPIDLLAWSNWGNLAPEEHLNYEDVFFCREGNIYMQGSLPSGQFKEGAKVEALVDRDYFSPNWVIISLSVWVKWQHVQLERDMLQKGMGPVVCKTASLYDRGGYHQMPHRRWRKVNPLRRLSRSPCGESR